LVQYVFESVAISKEKSGEADLKNNKTPILMLCISAGGFLLFYFVPFLLSLYYAFIENPFTQRFVGLDNFVSVFKNYYFRLGLTNTATFMAISIPLNLVLSLAIALVIGKIRWHKHVFILIFLIPLAIPSATTAFFWSNLFAVNGPVNSLLGMHIDWFKSEYGLLVIVLISLWKNIGYNMALFISGLGDIPNEYYEVARVYGASRFQMFRKITLVYLMPTFFLTLIMSFVNAFKVFKEVYIITGETPPEAMYTLQHYMNSTFRSLNYQKMVSAVYILTVLVIMFVGIVFKGEKKLSRNLQRL